MKVKIISNNNIEVNSKDYIYLQSYDSMVARITKSTGLLIVDKTVANYSVTTKKHFNQFTKRHKDIIKKKVYTNHIIKIE